jgi:predicted nucleotidyltransferase component of viral defense system
MARTIADIAADYRAGRAEGHDAAMARFQNEEACLVLLTVLEGLAAEPTSFIHEVAIKGGMLMAGELRSPRASADIDATTGRGLRVDADRVITEVRRAGRQFNVGADGASERTLGGEIIHLRFDSLTDGGTAKIEISVREDLVFAVRDAIFDVSDLGITPFTIPAIAEVELVAEKIRTLVQRDQPRDLFDLHLYLTDSNWYLNPAELRQAIDAKLETTRYKRWQPGLWKTHLDQIEMNWEKTLERWMAPDHIPPFAETVASVERRLRELRVR